MSAKIVNGTEAAQQIASETGAEVARLRGQGVRPHLVSVQVGTDAVSRIYVRNQQRRCQAIGIRYTHLHLDAQTEQEEVIEHVTSLNENRGVTGIIVQLPLPEGISGRRVQSAIASRKDVEGVSPRNIGEVVQGCPKLPPCTAAGVLRLLEGEGIKLEGAEACVVGHSEIVGKPIALLLLAGLATTTVCHIATRDLAAHTRRADVLISAVGKPGLITADMVKPGAFVADVGMAEVPVLDADGRPVHDEKGKPKTKLTGDVDFDRVREVAGYLTPIPGGCGPMTLALLMRNTVVAAAQAAGIPTPLASIPLATTGCNDD